MLHYYFDSKKWDTFYLFSMYITSMFLLNSHASSLILRTYITMVYGFKLAMNLLIMQVSLPSDLTNLTPVLLFCCKIKPEAHSACVPHASLLSALWCHFCLSFFFPLSYHCWRLLNSIDWYTVCPSLILSSDKFPSQPQC